MALGVVDLPLNLVMGDPTMDHTTDKTGSGYEAEYR